MTLNARYEAPQQLMLVNDAHALIGLGHHQRRKGRLPGWPRKPRQLLGRQQRWHQLVHGLLGLLGLSPSSPGYPSGCVLTTTIAQGLGILSPQNDSQLGTRPANCRAPINLRGGALLPLNCRTKDAQHPAVLSLSAPPGRRHDTTDYTSHPFFTPPPHWTVHGCPTNGFTSVVLCTILRPALFLARWLLVWAIVSHTHTHSHVFHVVLRFFSNSCTLPHFPATSAARHETAVEEARVRGFDTPLQPNPLSRSRASAFLERTYPADTDDSSAGARGLLQ